MTNHRPVLTCSACSGPRRRPWCAVHRPVVMPAWVFVVLLVLVVGLALAAGRASAPTSLLDRLVSRLPAVAPSGAGGQGVRSG